MMKMLKKISVLCLVVVLLISSSVTSVDTYAASSYKSWKAAYKAVVTDLSVAEAESGSTFEWLESYFGDDFAFTKYFCYNLDKKGAPELFLCSNTSHLTVVFTYKNGELDYLGLCDLYGINKSKKTIIQHGHYSGAGGSYEDEWYMFKLSGTSMSCIIQMDKGSFYTGGYSVSYKNKSYENGTYAKKLYKRLKTNYIKKATKYKNFKKYKLGNTKGVKK